MAFDVNNNYTGAFYGKDRLGHTTPDADGTDVLRPWVPTAYPAPWLPVRRQDDGHPVGAGIVISSHQLVGFDKSGYLVPAGLKSGTQVAATSDTTAYHLVKYGADDVAKAINPQTGALVAAAGEYFLMSVPSGVTATSQVAGGGVIDGVTILQADIDFARLCNLIPGKFARAVGYAIYNVYQFLGGFNDLSPTGVAAASGALYSLDGVNPSKFQVHNYKHQMMVPFQTCMGLRLPWVGALMSTIQTLATNDSVASYTLSAIAKSYVRAVGTQGLAMGNFFPGAAIVPCGESVLAAGNVAPYDSAVHTPDMICGQVLAFEAMYPIKDKLDKVRTQFDRIDGFLGPWTMNPTDGKMGGTSTRGMDYAINVATDGVFRKAKDQGKSLHPEYYSYLLVRFQA